jgi:imidazole glycerol-phosphate synthase subunit HisH
LNMPEVAVIDYGLGNLLSVRRGLEHCGATVTVTSDPDTILSAPRVVLPGVGSFAHGMAELRNRGLDSIVRKVAVQGSFLLGICLGMQMLLDESEEFGKTEGLGIISGRVVPIPPTTIDGFPQKIPHIGWNNLVLPKGLKSWEDSLLQEINFGEAVYFVHSYMAVPKNPEDRIADCIYGGISVSAAIGRNNIYGCQFHPEKSGEIGLNILRRFLSL